jgi:hypothetical protein
VLWYCVKWFWNNHFENCTWWQLVCQNFLDALGLGSLIASNEEVSWSCVVMAIVCKDKYLPPRSAVLTDCCMVLAYAKWECALKLKIIIHSWNVMQWILSFSQSVSNLFPIPRQISSSTTPFLWFLWAFGVMICAAYVPLSFGSTSDFCVLYCLPQAAVHFPYFNNYRISEYSLYIWFASGFFLIIHLPRYLTSGLWPIDTFQVIYFTVQLKI